MKEYEMTDVSIVGPGQGEALLLPGFVQMRILEDGHTTAHRLGVAELTLPPGATGPAQHRHARHDEGFYVVSGVARFIVGDRSHDAPAGTLVMVPPGAPHTFANPGSEPAVLLNTFTPDLYLAYFRELQALQASGEVTPPALAAAMARYATEPATEAAPNVTMPNAGPVPITLTSRGDGPAVLLLHGGAGPQSVTGFADRLAAEAGVRVITPVHPGFQGTLRPDGLSSARDLAVLYSGLLKELDATDVTIIGHSIGGWIAAELGLLASPRLARIVLIDAVGVEVPDHPVVDFFGLSLAQVAEHSYHDPARFRIDPSTLTPEQQAIMAGNRAALLTYGGTSMTDPSLATRLSAIALPTLVVWGASDRIADPGYGRALAAAIPGARFDLLPETGHVPQIESPDRLLAALVAFLRS
jgi:pimeloyl-ACP methyl ester carboxylesterase/mannose-6-phosphate isomerase-like protein (cupin superfamily)